MEENVESVAKKKSGFATAGLVLGIIGICTSFIPIINNLSFILGIIAIIFGVVSLIKKASKGMAIAGIIISILAIIITINAQKAAVDIINEAFNENPQTTVTTSTNNAQTTSTNNSQENVKVNVGEEVTIDNKLKVVFSSANEDFKGYSQYSSPKSGYKVVRAELSFENVSDSDISIWGIDCYADSEKMEDFYVDDYKSSYEDISAGKKNKAILYYEVPINAESIILEYDASWWSNKKVEFIIK